MRSSDFGRSPFLGQLADKPLLIFVYYMGMSDVKHNSEFGFRLFANDAFNANADQCPLCLRWRPFKAGVQFDAMCQDRTSRRNGLGADNISKLKILIHGTNNLSTSSREG